MTTCGRQAPSFAPNTFDHFRLTSSITERPLAPIRFREQVPEPPRFASFSAGAAQNDKCADSKNYGGHAERGAHSDQIRQTWHTEARNRHETEKTEAENGRDAAAQRPLARAPARSYWRGAKFIESPMARMPIAAAVSKKLLERDMQNIAPRRRSRCRHQPKSMFARDASATRASRKAIHCPRPP